VGRRSAWAACLLTVAAVGGALALGAVMSTARRLLDAVAEGHEQAQVQAARHDVEARRAFVRSLLHGGSPPGKLAELAMRFGLALAGHHQVTVARADTPFDADDGVGRQVETNLAARFGSRNILVTTDEGMLVCVATAALRGSTGEFVHHLLAVLGGDRGWRIGVGRAHPGPAGVQRSYEEARDTLQLADRLGLDATVLRAADLLVFPVLLRDRAAMEDLVESVLSPLVGTRGGAAPYLATLAAYFAAQGNISATARKLRITPRAVTYRLDRIRRVTGYDPDEQTQRFTLEAAVLGGAAAELAGCRRLIPDLADRNGTSSPRWVIVSSCKEVLTQRVRCPVVRRTCLTIPRSSVIGARRWRCFPSGERCWMSENVAPLTADELAYVDELAKVFGLDGYPFETARVVGYLLISDPPAQSVE